MKRILILLFAILTTLSHAQTYKYIGVEDGLSNQQVYAIQKGPQGYMWFLTRYGIDRYDGKFFKHYKLMDNEDREINSMLSLSWLNIAEDGTLWEFGRRGHVFSYDNRHDRYRLRYSLPDSLFHNDPEPVSFAFIDRNDLVWLCHDTNIYLYDAHTNNTTVMTNTSHQRITQIVQTDTDTYYVGTVHGLFRATLHRDKHRIDFDTYPEMEKLNFQIEELYYDEASKKLFIATLLQDMFVLDEKEKLIKPINTSLRDISITCIRRFDEHHILIATNGAGVYRMNMDTYACEPYIVADYNSYNGMNGNNIYDVFVDKDRIWMSNYPVGVTLLNNLFSSYQWIRHSIGNSQSLVNNQVNYILQDKSGDVWYATNNGISLYHSASKQWESFLSMTDNKDITNHIFLTLCEVSPGVIWAAGYGYTIYEIRKDTRSIRSLSPGDYGAYNLLPDKYIRTIITDSKGFIWAGGYYNLKKLDFNKKSLRLYPGLNGITDLTEKCPDSLWVGTATGLYLLDKVSGAYRNIPLPSESFYVTALHQDSQGTLYIGTNSSGIMAYHPDKGTFKHLYTDNSGLISNCINTILEDGHGNLLLGTDHGLTSYNPRADTFRNWTKEQGLKIEHFNPQSGVLLKNGNFLFGSTDGAISFSRDMKLPTHYHIELLFSEFRLFYRTVYPGDKGSPLKESINDTRTLRLNYDQNIFSIDLSCVNYDYPSLPLYTWKMEGFYDQWSPPNSETRLRFNNLTPGKYLLQVRAISAEDRSIILRERSIEVIINPPFWQTIWAWLFYLLLLGAITYVIIRLVAMRRTRQESNEKIQFFINTAHDIRTPLTLIKAPLEEVEDRHEMPVEAAENIRIALRNVNALLRLTTNLINFERVDTYSDTLYTSEYELGTYLTDVILATEAYANNRHVALTYHKEFTYLNVLIDKDKMDSILKNILSNALKYTPEGGEVDVVASDTEHHWSVEVTDTGIGIPLSEQRKLFRTHFRGSNAINSKVTGSGIGLLLVWKLVHLHKGKIIFRSTEGEGTYVKVIFPKDGKAYKNAIYRGKQEEVSTGYSEAGVPRIIPPLSPLKSADAPTDSQSKILVVEDNDDLREYLLNSLSDTYTVQVCENGRKALELIKLGLPDLIISDVMMPEMRGDELCAILKNDIETSHIPVILLTALSTDKDIIDGLHTGADEYIVKPFNIGILRATIANLINNRALLKKKYAQPGAEEEIDENDCINCGDLDRHFLSSVRKHIEEHLDSPSFTVDTLCGLLYMSRTSFYNKMKALTDQAPADYIRLVRLNRATQMLREQKHTIAEIALLTGFSDAKYFREVFKKHYKQTPSQYAKREEPEASLPNDE